MNYKVPYYLSIHVETTGISVDPKKPVYDGCKIVSLAAAICDKETFREIDSMIVFFKVKGDENDIGTSYHGISKSFLEEHGVDEDEGIEEFFNFLEQYIDTTYSIICMGQNPHAFAIPFLKDLLNRNGVSNAVRFSSCSFDVFSVTASTIGETTIKQLIDIFGDVDKLEPFQQSKEYTSLLKAKTFIEIIRRINRAWTKKVMK